MAIYFFLVDLVECSRSSWPIPRANEVEKFWICSHREARRLLKELEELENPNMLVELKLLMVFKSLVELQELMEVEELLELVE